MNSIFFPILLVIVAFIYMWITLRGNSEPKPNAHTDIYTSKKAPQNAAWSVFISACMGGLFGFIIGCIIGANIGLPTADKGLEFLYVGVLMTFVGIPVGIFLPVVFRRIISGK